MVKDGNEILTSTLPFAPFEDGVVFRRHVKHQGPYYYPSYISSERRVVIQKFSGRVLDLTTAQAS